MGTVKIVKISLNPMKPEEFPGQTAVVGSRDMFFFWAVVG
jgi:hypothetical protein